MLLPRTIAYNFNSRPSARGDAPKWYCGDSANIISIHAPPRGATRRVAGSSRPRRISIHAPPRGATCSSMPGCFLPTLFQFTPLREGRRFSLSSASVPAPFQFTPLREGRRVFPIIVAFSSYFNSRPSARGDRSSSCRPSSAALYFNSRPSARGDGTRRVLGVLESYFNSRPSARGDDGVRLVLAVRPISIHAPPRGATATAFFAPVVLDAFQFTPLREGRQVGESCFATFGVFQFTPLREGRLYSAVTLLSRCYFNSRPSARGDMPTEDNAVATPIFQFTPLREGRRADSSAAL